MANWKIKFRKSPPKKCSTSKQTIDKIQKALYDRENQQTGRGPDDSAGFPTGQGRRGGTGGFMNIRYSARFIRFTFPRFFTAGTFGVDANSCGNSVQTGRPSLSLFRQTGELPLLP